MSVDCQGIVSGLSGDCQWIVRGLSVDCQGIVSGFSGDCQWIDRSVDQWVSGLLGYHQGSGRGLNENCQRVVRGLSGGLSGIFWRIVRILSDKGNRTIADLRYRGTDIISPNTLIFVPIKG